MSGDSYERIAYQVQAAVATITLNRPEKRNALDDLTITELKQGLRAADADASVKVIVLRGAGNDFCAGADLSQLEKIAAGGTPDENLEDAMRLGELLIQMRRMLKPIIAAVHGNALAGGAGIATACDLIIADEHATLGYPEVRLGFVPAMVMPLLVRRVGEKIAFELTAFGRVITATEAHRLGLVNRVTSGDFERELALYAAELATRSASAVQLIKGLLYDIDGMTLEAAVARGAEVNVAARMTDDCREGVREFLDAHRK